jgi:hypothetical protein
MRTIFALTLLLIASATNALADRSVPAFVSGNWTGIAFYHGDGSFGLCSISTEYQSGISITFGLLPDGIWKIGFGQTGGFSSNVQRQLRLYVDGKFVYGAPADHSDDTLVLTLPSTADLFHSLRMGHVLKVITPGGTAEFSLAGTAAAFLEMLDCVRRHSGQNTASVPSALERAQQTHTEAAIDDRNKFTRDQALTYAANLLAAANITGYRFLPFEETKHVGDVVWTFDNDKIGALFLFRNIQDDVDVDRLSASVTQDDGVSCKGDFVSGKKASRRVDAVEVTRSFSACSAEENSFYFEYSWMRLPNGAFIRLVNGGFGADSDPDDVDTRLAQRSEEAVLKVSLPE